MDDFKWFAIGIIGIFMAFAVMAVAKSPSGFCVAHCTITAEQNNG